MDQQNQRSKLQEKIAADLQEKARRTANQTPPEPVGVEDMKFLEGTQQTTGLAWAWAVVFLVAVVIVIMFLM